MAAVSKYRAYFLKDGHVIGPPAILICDNDREAVKRAKQLRDCADIEVWDLDRRVAEIKTGRRI